MGTWTVDVQERASGPMEGKKGPTAGPESMVTKQKLTDFVGEVKAELGRITWTSPEEMKVYVKVVVGATLAMGFGIYFVDLAIQNVLRGMNVIVQLLGG